MAIPCLLCGAPITCVICETCEEHCLSGGAAACLAAHEDWLQGGTGGMVSTGPTRRPENADEIRAALARAVAELERSRS